MPGKREEGGELDSYDEVRLSFPGPGEIKMREVVLDPQESPGEIKSRKVELVRVTCLCVCGGGVCVRACAQATL